MSDEQCRSGQIKFFLKSHIDLDRPNPVLSVTDAVALNDGAAYLKYLRNRNNNSGWNTTDSTDAANTQLLFEMFDLQKVDMVMLVVHNFKNYLLEYWDILTGTWQTYVNVTNNTLETTIHEISIETDKMRLTILNTIIADDDKSLRQMIITEKFIYGQLQSFPQIKAPVSSVNKKRSTALSGKSRIVETRGSFSASLEVKFLVIDNDLTLIENLFFHREGVLMLLSGGLESQFRSQRIGYRNKDICLVRPINELELPWTEGVYINGIAIKINVDEVIK